MAVMSASWGVIPKVTIARRFMCVLMARWSIGESVPVVTTPPPRTMALT